MDYNISVNVKYKNTIHTNYDFKQQDYGQKLIVTAEDYDINGTTARLFINKADGTVNERVMVKENDSYTYTLDAQDTSCPGVIVADIKYYKNGVRDSSASFIFGIIHDRFGKLIESKTLSDSLQSALDKVDKTNEIIDDYDKKIVEINQATTGAQHATATINTTNQTVTDNESARISAENTRKSDETTRQSQEQTRQTNTSTAITKADAATTRANLAAKSCEDIASGIIELPDIGTPGTYTKVITDKKGRVTSGSTPTTIADLGITNVYTKTEIDTKTNDINTSLANQIGTASGASINLPTSFNGGLLLKELQGKSVQNGTPTPETKADIASVGDNGSVVVRVTGKNLFPNPVVKTVNGITLTIAQDGTVTLNGTSTNVAIFAIPFDLPFANTQYSFSANNPVINNQIFMRIMKNASGDVWSNHNYSLHMANMKETFTNTVPGIATGVAIRIGSGETLTNFTLKPQLELGSPTTYEPYKEQLITIPLTQPLRSVGSVYDRGSVKVNGLWGNERKFAIAVFDGSADEAWTNMTTNTTDKWRHSIKITNAKISNISSVTSLCNRFNLVGDGGTFTKSVGYTITSTSDLVLYYMGSDLATFRTWLATNPITVVYELVTPVFEPYPQAIQDTLNKLQTYPGVTNVFTTDSLQPNMIVQYGKTDTSALALYAENVSDNKLDKSKSVNNLITTVEGTVLDGRQGKALNEKIGTLSNLTTASKTDLVGAVNEVNNNFTIHSSSTIKTVDSVINKIIKKEVVKISCVGDSVTEDICSFHTVKYPSLLQNDIRFLTYSSNTTVINKGVSGNKSSDILARIDSIISDSPDIVILMCGINDMYNNVSIADYKANLSSIVSKLLSNNIAILGLTQTPVFNENVQNQIAYVQASIEVYKRFNIRYIDSHKKFEDKIQDGIIGTYSSFPDYVHPNDNGLRFIKDMIMIDLFRLPIITKTTELAVSRMHYTNTNSTSHWTNSELKNGENLIITNVAADVNYVRIMFYCDVSSGAVSINNVKYDLAGKFKVNWLGTDVQVDTYAETLSVNNYTQLGNLVGFGMYSIDIDYQDWVSGGYQFQINGIKVTV